MSQKLTYRNHAVDIHSHIIMNVDDGANSIPEAMAMLRLAYDEGISVVFATPHYGIENGYSPAAASVKSKFDLLRKEVLHEIPEMTLFLGTEWYCADDVSKRICEHKAYMMNNTDYALVEFLEYGDVTESTETIIDRLKCLCSSGIHPILAHAERYRSLQQDRNALQTICEMGVLLQVNAFDIALNNNQATRELSQWLAKEKMISFIGSDMHGLPPKRSPKMLEGINWLYENTDEKYADAVVRKNAEKYLFVPTLQQCSETNA